MAPFFYIFDANCSPDIYMMKRPFFLLLLTFITSVGFAQKSGKNEGGRQRIDLKGQWQFALDTSNTGITAEWFKKDLPDKIMLPGTTDINKKGFLNKDSTTMHLSRVYRYEGPAWYRRKVTIPKSFFSKHIRLVLERSKTSKIWIDDVLVGGSSILQAPQEFDLSKYLSPGDHVITIQIDNTLKLTPYGNVHIYSEDAQTNWNGIIGEFFLEASAKTYINNLQVYPDIQQKKINVQLGIENHKALRNVDIIVAVEKTLNGKTVHLKAQTYELPSKALLDLTYELGNDSELWDEYHQPLYKVTVAIAGRNMNDVASSSFGMRKFAIKGTQFTINDRTIFLRGKHDAAVFPLTGHPPMDAEGWIKVFNIAKSYGINHYRFHSWSPPAAAFDAADEVGMYLQVELPFWGGLDDDGTAMALRAEGIAMLKNFANHPSFVLFSHGNEIWGGHERVEQNILAFKAYDSRPLYTMGSNVNIGYFPLQKSSDFFVGTRTKSEGDTILTHTRLTHAFADSKNGARLNSLAPSADIKYDYPVAQMKVPIISHEIGQYQIYPDYKEIKKYTGVVEARNLEIFRDRLKHAGMLDQNLVFQKASGAWAALCYKAEMEAAIRTKGFGGFQLLDLQDFPGQGTALVGILDAFMDSKNVISREEWLKSCNDVVLLLEFPKFVYTSQESFNAKIQVANYSDKSLEKGYEWSLTTEKGTLIKQGTVRPTLINSGGITSLEVIDVPLDGIKKAERVTARIALSDGSYTNTYSFWVFPNAAAKTELTGINVVTSLDDDVFRKLQKGAKVLLMPQTDAVKDNSVPGLFPPEFWNWGMFKSISESNKKPVSPGTLGLLTDPKHPIFSSFPTDAHTNWQWFSIIKASNALILDQTDATYRPIVQVIDNLERNHKMGMVFEFKIGKGKLLVCTSQLNKIMDKPEARQFYNSLVDYMKSTKFKPVKEITKAQLKSLKLSVD
jgi:hypothetical protein